MFSPLNPHFIPSADSVRPSTETVHYPYSELALSLTPHFIWSGSDFVEESGCVIFLIRCISILNHCGV